MTTWNPYVFKNSYIIVPLMVFCLLVMQIMICGFVRNREKRIFYSSRMWLFFSVFTVLSATVIGRPVFDEGQRIKLDTFWTIRRAWIEHSGRYWYFVIGNIALFIPFGTLFPIAFPKMRKWWLVSFIGLLFSCIIEFLQYRFHLGVCELDDLIHNTLGTFLGYQIFTIIYWLDIKGRNRKNLSKLWRVKVIFSAVLLAGVILLFIILIYKNQPDWSGVTVF